jgi:transposase
MAAQCFETMGEDLRLLLREFAGRDGQPSAMILDSRTLQSTPESGAGPSTMGRRKGSKVHAAVDTLGHLLALHVTAADEQDWGQVEKLAEQVQQITGESVELAYVDQGYTGEHAAESAQKHGIWLEVVKHTEAKRGFVLLPRRWVVERSFAWAARFQIASGNPVLVTVTVFVTVAGPVGRHALGRVWHPCADASRHHIHDSCHRA